VSTTTTDVATISPDVDAQIAEVLREVSPLVQRAGEMQVRDDAEAASATEFLAQLAARKRTIEKERRGIVDPINQGVKVVNERMKAAQEPLDEANTILRAKMQTFMQEQERLRKEAEAELRKVQERQQREADERQRADEERARVAREDAEREARAAADAEAEAEKAREAERDGLAGEMAGLSAIDLASIIAHGVDGDRVVAAREEMDVRRTHRQAEEDARAAAARAETARQAEQAAQDRPAAAAPLVEVPKTAPIRTGAGSASTRSRWVAYVTDPAAVPRTYMIPDQKRLNEAVKNGVREIPGVNIHEVTDLAIRTK
jgi:hypothetical protein